MRADREYFVLAFVLPGQTVRARCRDVPDESFTNQELQGAVNGGWRGMRGLPVEVLEQLVSRGRSAARGEQAEHAPTQWREPPGFSLQASRRLSVLADWALNAPPEVPKIQPIRNNIT